MTTELAALAWACVLAFVHLALPIGAKTLQYGAKWNMGARDEPQEPLGPVAGRLDRAQANYYESFPLFAAAILIVTAANLENESTAQGALMWLGARAVYLPLYALGIPVLRTIVFAVSISGLLMILMPALRAALPA